MSRISSSEWFRPRHGPRSPGYRMCETTVMDTSDPGILFDRNGNSQFVRIFREKTKKEVKSDKKQKFIFEKVVKSILQKKGINCICGVSGGVDSSTVLLRAVQAGLRPLAVHLDNGWNDELAVSNIEILTKKLDVELYTHVLDWESFRSLQRSFFKASVPNVEMATDHAIVAVLYQIANRFGLKHILTGSNISSEAFLQTNAGHDNKDWHHIRSIHKKFESISLKNYPHLNSAQFCYMILFKKIKYIPFLNYFNYNRDSAKDELITRIGWKDYGRKHGESKFTRFFQEYYLPEKFGIDKRRAHLSCQILAGQITREEALHQLSRPLWKPGELEENTQYVCSKLGFSSDEWKMLMSAPPRTHYSYPFNPFFKHQNSQIYQFLRRTATARD